MASQARHELVAPQELCASRNVVPHFVAERVEKSALEPFKPLVRFVDLHLGRGTAAVKGDFGDEVMTLRGAVAVPNPVIAHHHQLAVIAGEGRDVIQALGFVIALGNGEANGVVVGWRGTTGEPGDECERDE